MTQRETNREAESVHHKMILDKTGWGKETKESNNKDDETDRRPASRGVGNPERQYESIDSGVRKLKANAEKG